jgi:1-deoxy-D-xylulose-5-phosphate synthase
MLVILNDNKMSISPNVGAMTRYLTRLIASSKYTPGTIFEEMGFAYFGPVDGNDVDALVTTLSQLKQIKGPRLLHIVTRKGKGYAPAEVDGLAMHAATPFDPVTGPKKSAGGADATFTTVFTSWMLTKAHADKDLHVVTPAMREGSGLVAFHDTFPDRYHDVGIAEQHSVTFAAGLACEGKKPVVAIYSTFLQRAYDQVIHDVAIQNLDVLFAIDRAGIVGPDGETHAGSFDLSFLRCIPNIVLMAPADAQECTQMLELGFAHQGPAAVRYPRAKAIPLVAGNSSDVAMGTGAVVRQGKHVALLSFGALLDRCMTAAEQLDATVVNMRFVKPLDGALLELLAKTHTHFVTIEDNAVMGGAGSAVNEYCYAHNIAVRIHNLGLPDTFLPHGTRDEVLSDAGLDAVQIAEAITRFVSEK